MSDNLINKIINAKEKLKGELGREQDAYKEFLNGNWESEEKDLRGLIIELYPQNSVLDEIDEGKSLTKIAADGNSEEVVKNESYFYVSKDETFALKIDERTVPEETVLTASIISESGRDLSNCVLYCPETNKYFLYNTNNEIILSGFKNFTYREFTFNLIYPKAKIFFVLPKESEEFTAISTNISFNINKVSNSGNTICIELSGNEHIKTVVMRSDKYIDFIPIINNEILIAKTLTGVKFELLVY